MTLGNIAKNIGNWLLHHRSEILVGIGITGFGASVITAVKATPKAREILQEIKEEYDEDSPKESYVKIVKKVVPHYIPSVALFVASSACVILSYTECCKEKTALAAACSLAEGTMRKYSSLVENKIGPKKNEELKEKAKNETKKDMQKDNKVVSVYSKNIGLYKCYEPISKTYFDSNAQKINKAINKLGREMLSERYISVNDILYELGLESIKYGDDIGWNVDNGLIDIAFGSKLTDDDEPVLEIKYLIEPKKNYMF